MVSPRMATVAALTDTIRADQCGDLVSLRNGEDAGTGLRRAGEASCGAIGRETRPRARRWCFPDAATAEILRGVTAVRIMRDRRYGEAGDIWAGAISAGEIVVFCQQMMGELNALFRF